jgi:hypothetical protein
VKSVLPILFLLLLTAQTCRKSDIDLAPAVFKHWVHSFEEDTGGIQTYRPASYNFPLSRGREGFEVKENGTFIRHSIAPADGIEKIPGTWTAAGENKLRIQFNSSDFIPYTIQILQASDTLLTLKKISK